MARSAPLKQRKSITLCLIYIFMQCITEKGYTACRALREWKRARSDAFFRQQCLPGVFHVNRLCFQKDKCEKATWAVFIWCRRTKLNPNIWMERIRCTEIAWLWRETTLTIFSGNALLTVDANRCDSAVCPRTNSRYFVLFWYPLCTLSNAWERGVGGE